MRKEQKKQAEDMMALLTEAHTEIKKNMKAGTLSVAQELLAQCQECVISFGNWEAVLEQGTELVSLLEKYCEQVFYIYKLISENYSVGNTITGNVRTKINNRKIMDDTALAWKKLEQLLHQIKKNIKDIKVRKLVVFLPYKASMWDSLESVWKATEEDPACDAYVVPIPYYDKNPNGDFKEFHYEGDLYPNYVPITDYRTFDLEKVKPDMIFIHNPYDECNYVTSVHPQFYSEKLKDYTEKLIYIPYFVLGDINPNNDAEVESMAHFCTLPGVMNVNKVIVQSESMRQAYIKVLMEFVKGSTRAYWENRILGLGSPKLDKVQNTKLEDLEIPEQWQKIIKRADGSRKKVILYNNSVSALLQHDMKMIEKMKDVFRIFYENREEVVLLWRPHPLIKATIEAMRPQLWKEYEKMMEEYRKAGWGIYDDTAELDRAIELSDAYYGDGSSVVKLYQEKERMILIQDMRKMK